MQAGHFRDDFNLAMPDATLPAGAVWLPYVNGTLNQAGDFKLNGDLNGSLVVTKKVRLWITGNIKLTGNDKIMLTGNGSLELYLGNTSGATVSADFGGGSVQNSTRDAINFKVYGLPTCIQLQFRGNNELVGVIYAPNADVDLNGTPDIYGSVAAKSIDISGNAGIHYDEALGVKNGQSFTIIAWEEL